jgi:hypothetical protein
MRAMMTTAIITLSATRMIVQRRGDSPFQPLDILEGTSMYFGVACSPSPRY